MELRQYWHLVRKWVWLVVLGGLLAGGAAYFVNSNEPPVYRTSTTIMISPGTPLTMNESYMSLIASERLALTYAQLLTSNPVMQEAIRRLETAVESDPLAGAQDREFQVAAEPVPDTQLLRLRVTGTDPEYIALAANTVVEVFSEWQDQVQRSKYAESKTSLANEMERVQASIEETEARVQALETAGAGADSDELSRLQDQLAQYQNSYSSLLSSYSNIELAEANSGDTLTVVSPATPPLDPIGPQVVRNTVLAAILGAALAAGVAFLIEYLDDTVKGPEDLRTAGLSTISVVHRVNPNGREGMARLFTVAQAKSMASEAYRTLRTNLQFSSLDRPLRSLVVTSALATEGKTTTSANLAVVMAQAGKRIVLVDSDLRRPNVHKLFDLPNREGLTSALVAAPEKLADYLQETEVENLRVLTAGPIPPNPQELLGSQRMEEMMRQLQGEAEMVILDTPPVLAVSDANVLAARADGVILVVNAGGTRRAAVSQAVESLTQVGAHLLGGVLNKVKTRGGRGSYYYYSYYYSGDRAAQEQRGIGGWLRRVTGRSQRRKKRREPAQGQEQGAERGA